MCRSVPKRVLHIVLNTGPTNMGFNEFHKLTAAHSECLSFESSTESMFSANRSLFYFFLKSRLFASQFDVIHLHSQMLAFIVSLSLLITYPIGLKKCVYTVHTSRSNLSKRNFVFFFIALVLCRKVVACSSSSYQSFSLVLRNVFRGKFTYVTNGVLYYNYLGDPVIRKNRSLVSVGRVIKLKRPDMLLDALMSVRADFSCKFIGDGEMLDQLASSVASDDRFSFLGLRPRKDVISYMLGSQIFISASSVEGMPISALEAAASGCYLLLSDIPPHREIAKEIGHCSMFNSEDDLKEQVELLLAKPDCFFKSVSRENKRVFQESFSVENMLMNYQQIYAEIS